MITPLDIENKKFSKKTLNGYDPDEVDDFLDELTKDYTELYRKANESDSKIDSLESELKNYKNLEDTLQKTLVMAQSASDEVKKNAKEQADKIIADAEKQAKESVSEYDSKIKDKEKELEDLKKKFDVYKAKMESLLISQLELLKDINKDI